MRLASLQRWMQAVVVHPGTTAEALRSREARAHLKPARLESVLLPSKTLSAAQRIAIYQEMYPLRMRDALASDYPGLEHFLGPRFWDFVTAYTKAHPSMGYTLNRLGDQVPAFLARQKALKPAGFLRDLARLELAITESFDSPQADLLSAEDLEAMAPARLGRARLLTAPSLRLVSLEWNAGAYLDTVRDEKHDHPRPRRSRSFTAVVRRNYSVYRFPLSEAAFLVLTDLQDGCSIASSVERAMGRRGSRRAAAEDFAGWFRTWTAEGVFSGIRRGRASAP
ncbi:MAG TPA: putative DNA-binding domain-containing protein [Vicinamibacteria bacterium]|nr:putative DNA-binding domain-containing protein [Vicinamibacteria bacterium]